MPAISDLTLLILAGGESRRMGRYKLALPWRGTTLIEERVAALGPGFAEVLIATDSPHRLPAGLQPHAIPDARPAAGPLAGIAAGLERMRTRALFAVAGDMPFVGLPLAEALAVRLGRRQAVVPFVGARPDPFCAIYSAGALGPLESFLDADAALSRRSPAAYFLTRLDVRYVGRLEFLVLGLEERMLWNLNTPADYQVLDAPP